MKKFLNVAFLIVILLSTACLTNCKKDEPVTPTVTVVANDTCKSIISDLPTNLTETTTFLVSDNPCEDLYGLRNHILTIIYVSPGDYDYGTLVVPYSGMTVLITDENKIYKYNGINWQPL